MRLNVKTTFLNQSDWFTNAAIQTTAFVNQSAWFTNAVLQIATFVNQINLKNATAFFTNAFKRKATLNKEHFFSSFCTSVHIYTISVGTGRASHSVLVIDRPHQNIFKESNKLWQRQLWKFFMSDIYISDYVRNISDKSATYWLIEIWYRYSSNISTNLYTNIHPFKPGITIHISEQNN